MLHRLWSFNSSSTNHTRYLRVREIKALFKGLEIPSRLNTPSNIKKWNFCWLAPQSWDEFKARMKLALEIPSFGYAAGFTTYAIFAGDYRLPTR